MKRFLILLLLFSTSIFSQKYNVKKGAIANGYDVVAYFSNKAVKGNKKIKATHDGVSFLFSSQENLNLFKKDPKKYIPKYGGFCAYAIGKTSERVSINPKTFQISNGELYLFYNSWGNNTLQLWQQEGAKELQKKANKNWKEINQ
ncbi:YHS domain-containing (seleno)protein [Tenacibaculum ovolyticum]|uniref:YHS domain-containing (seleno)protein n=1 Tax=Tenacibaculum ovolyticum TaxID=104270 RepID=UPI003BA8B8B2